MAVAQDEELVVGGSTPAYSGPRAKVSLGKTLNLKLLPLCVCQMTKCRLNIVNNNKTFLH